MDSCTHVLAHRRDLETFAALPGHVKRDVIIEMKRNRELKESFVDTSSSDDSGNVTTR